MGLYSKYMLIIMIEDNVGIITMLEILLELFFLALTIFENCQQKSLLCGYYWIPSLCDVKSQHECS